MEESKQIKVFDENKYLAEFKKLSELKKEIANLQATEKKVKEELKSIFEEYGIKQFKNEFVTVSSVSGSADKLVFDEQALKDRDPKTYESLVNDYPLKGIDIQKWELTDPDEYKEFFDTYHKVGTKGKSGYIRIEAK